MSHQQVGTDAECGGPPSHLLNSPPKKQIPSGLQKGLAGAQLVMAVMTVIFEILVIMFDMMPIGPTGILAGVMFGCAGGMGIINVAAPGRCSTIGFMILSILSLVMVIPLLAIDIESMMRSHNCSAGRKTFFCDEHGHTYATAAAILRSFSCLVAVCEAIVSILSSVMCVWVVCCTNNEKENAAPAMWVQVQKPPNVDVNQTPASSHTEYSDLFAISSPEN